jgi:hypothetical protein
MKNTMIAAIILALLYSPVQADEKINIINANRVGGAFFNAAQNLKDHSPESFNEIQSFNSCQIGAAILENTKEPTIVFWDFLTKSLNPDKRCDAMTEENFVTAYASSYYYVCSLKSKPENDLNKFIDETTKIGYYKDVVSQARIETTISEIGSKSKTIPYTSGNDLAAALEIGEIDYVYTPRIRESQTCVLSTDPNSQDITSISKFSDDVLVRANFTIAILGANLDEETKNKIHELVLDSLETENWKGNFSQFKDDISKQPRNEQYQILQNEIAAFKNSIK